MLPFFGVLTVSIVYLEKEMTDIKSLRTANKKFLERINSLKMIFFFLNFIYLTDHK